MTLFDWLATATGQEFTHAIIVLVLAVAAWLTWRTHQQTSDVAQKLSQHLELHDGLTPVELPPGSNT